MDLVSGYCSDGDDEIESDIQVSIPILTSAPMPVVVRGMGDINVKITKSDPAFSTMVVKNLKVEHMFASEQGPVNPFVDRQKNNVNLKIQETFVDERFFNESYHGYLSGTAQNQDEQIQLQRARSQAGRLLFLYHRLT